MQPEVSYGTEKQMNYEAWRDTIMAQVKNLEKERSTSLKA